MPSKNPSNAPSVSLSKTDAPSISPTGTRQRYFQAVSVTSSTAVSDELPVSNLISSFGMDVDANGVPLPTATVAFGTTNAGQINWVTDGVNNQKYQFSSINPTIIMDFGEEKIVNEIWIWNYAIPYMSNAVDADGYGGPNGSCMKSFHLHFATELDFPNFGAIPYNPTFELDGDLSAIPRSSGTVTTISAQNFTFTEHVKARYIELNPMDNFYGQLQAPDNFPFGSGFQVGIAEVVSVA